MSNDENDVLSSLRMAQRNKSPHTELNVATSNPVFLHAAGKLNSETSITSSKELGYEKIALQELFEKTAGKEWKNNSNWFTNQSDLKGNNAITIFERWHGVKVNDNQQVVEIELPKNRLKGSCVLN